MSLDPKAREALLRPFYGYSITAGRERDEAILAAGVAYGAEQQRDADHDWYSGMLAMPCDTKAPLVTLTDQPNREPGAPVDQSKEGK